MHAVIWVVKIVGNVEVYICLVELGFGPTEDILYHLQAQKAYPIGQVAVPDWTN